MNDLGRCGISYHRAYFLATGGGTGTFAPWHFPLPVLLPARRPPASRWVLVNDPAVLPLVAVVPASRPEASRTTSRTWRVLMIEWILHRPPHASNPSEIRVAERLKLLDASPHLWTVIWGSEARRAGSLRPARKRAPRKPKNGLP